MALVTGGASGIGAAAAVRLAADGYTVAVADRDAAGVAAQADRMMGLGVDVLRLVLDVTDPRSVQSAVGETVSRLGSLDALVHCAGVAGQNAPLWELDDWDQVLAVNLTGSFQVCRAVVPQMIATGWGRIVLVASIAGKEGNPHASAYSASKAGVIALVKSLGKELAKKAILVNAVAPALIDTPMVSQSDPEHVTYMTSRIPMGRLGDPSEVAALISWLCSEDCSFSTATVFDISGGRATY